MAEADANDPEDLAEPGSGWPVTTVVGALGIIAAVLVAFGFFNQEPWFVLGGFAGVAVTQLYRAVALRVGLPLGRFA
jgi:hypothetical protein